MCTTEDTVVKALRDDLLRQPKNGGRHGCTFAYLPKDTDSDVVLNGHVDLSSLARAAIKACQRTAGCKCP
jgi:hypothetical protein